jgi:hypothetical protein
MRWYKLTPAAQALNELMGPVSTFGAGPIKLAAALAVVLLAAGTAASRAGVVGHGVDASFRLQASVFSLPPQFEMHPYCPVMTADPNGACPLPVIPAETSTKRATIVLCSESLCGRGFHPGDTILLLATRAGGSTFWRTRADRSGSFRSALPAPLCRFAPVSLMAFDTHAYRSNRLSLGSTGCPDR